MEARLLKEIAIPAAAFCIGAVLGVDENTGFVGKLAMFFGAQTLMNLYMKAILSQTVILEDQGLEGIPGSFVVTAIQQLVAFLLFGGVLFASRFTSHHYTPKKLVRPMEYVAVLVFSLSFTMNIALNNFSLSLLPLSVNLIIRSCLPLATYMSQRFAATLTRQPVPKARRIDIVLMLIGCVCAAVAVVSTEHGGSSAVVEQNMAYGVLVCVASLFSGALNLALAGVLGTSIKLNSLDSTLYMSIPAFLLLLLPTFFYRHPINWNGYGPLTDWEILKIVLENRPTALTLAALSGVLALFYNVFQYGIVQSLSASYTAFAGNFNKAATIALGIIVGLESLPPAPWNFVMILAVFGNIASFTMYSMVSGQSSHGGIAQEGHAPGGVKHDEYQVVPGADGAEVEEEEVEQT